MRKGLLFILTAMLLPFQSSGQADSTEDWKTYDAYQEITEERKDGDSGEVHLHRSPLLESVLKAYRRMNEEDPRIEGYRVQLFFGEREKAEKLKARFLKEHPDVGAYIDYLAPNFRLRVGDHRTRIGAYRLMQKLGDDYGRPYIVRTRIELPELDLEGR